MSRSLAAAPFAVLALVCAAAGCPSAALADQQIYSYEPADDAARELAATGLSFRFERRPFGGIRIEEVIQTGEQGAADIRPTSDKALGPGGLKAALGDEKPVGGLYEIEPGKDGEAFTEAVCPGAERAWLVIGSLKRFEDLSIQAVGKDPGASRVRLCATLLFTFRNDWRLPERNPPRIRQTRGLP